MTDGAIAVLVVGAIACSGRASTTQCTGCHHDRNAELARVPGVHPSILNAYFALTGTRVRTLPVKGTASTPR